MWACYAGDNNITTTTHPRGRAVPRIPEVPERAEVTDWRRRASNTKNQHSPSAMLKVPLNPSSLAVRSIFCFIGRALKCTTMFPQWVHGLVIDLVRSCYSPEAGGLYRCQFFQRLDGFCWWKRTDHRILPSWARRPGTPEAAWTRPSEVGTSLWIEVDDPDEPNSLQSKYLVVLFRKAASNLYLPTVSISQQTSTREAAHTHIHAQWAECSKAVSTSAQRNRYQIIQRFFLLQFQQNDSFSLNRFGKHK